jgi:predicted DNA-binding protein (UPF0251 family)
LQKKFDKMPRPKRLRKVVAPPSFKGYKPYGCKKNNHEACELFYEEYEAIKLADYDSLSQKEASEVMGVSRPTFARIYATARQKIAKALVEAREITAVYGNAFFDKDWFQCKKCHSKFNIPPEADHHHCPLCQSEDIYTIQTQ